MPETAYQILSRSMRYVFLLLGILVFLLALLMMRRESRQWKKEKKQLPDSGRVGEAVDEDSMKVFPLPYQGTIGTSGRCDIRLTGREVKRRHADFLFEDGKGLRITPRRGAAVILDDHRIGRRDYALHGTRLRIGSTVLRIRLFAGLNTPERGISGDIYPDAGDDPLNGLGAGGQEWVEVQPLPTDHVAGEDDYTAPFEEPSRGRGGRNGRGRRNQGEE